MLQSGLLQLCCQEVPARKGFLDGHLFHSETLLEVSAKSAVWRTADSVDSKNKELDLETLLTSESSVDCQHPSDSPQFETDRQVFHPQPWVAENSLVPTGMEPRLGTTTPTLNAFPTDNTGQ